MTGVRALLLDVGGTLIRVEQFPSGEAVRASQIERLCEAFGCAYPWFRPLVDPSPPESCPPLWVQPTRTFVDSVLGAHDAELAAGDFQRICRACSLRLVEHVSLDASAAEAVRRARAMGLKLAICSDTFWADGMDSRRNWDDLGLGDCFDAHIISPDVGYTKPHVAMFQSALRALGVAPSEAAMVGDRPDRDIAGARAHGIRAIWRRPPGFTGSCEPEPDAEIADLGDLPAVLECWVGG